jgi:hypothetical protein
MTGYRKRLAQGLVATMVLSGLAFIVCAFFSQQGNIWERACIALMVLMLGAMVGALMLVAATFVALRVDVAKHLRRPPLSDEEFARMLAGPEGVDRELVRQVRELAARCFRRIGGERFYPDDRLEEDLHLTDLAPFGLKDLLAELEDSLELTEGEIRCRMAMGETKTFGELISVTWELASLAREQADVLESGSPAALRDPALDG